MNEPRVRCWCHHAEADHGADECSACFRDGMGPDSKHSFGALKLAAGRCYAVVRERAYIGVASFVCRSTYLHPWHDKGSDALFAHVFVGDNPKGGRNDAPRNAAQVEAHADTTSRTPACVSGDDLEVGDERLRDTAARDSTAGDRASSLPNETTPQVTAARIPSLTVVDDPLADLVDRITRGLGYSSRWRFVMNRNEARAVAELIRRRHDYRTDRIHDGAADE